MLGERIRTFFDEHYLPGNMVVAVAGDLDHGRAGGRAGRTGERPGRCAHPTPRRARRQRHATGRDPPLYRAGPRGPGPSARSTGTIRAATPWPAPNHVLGGGLSSRLFQEIRERRGLAYSVWSERVAYADAGFLIVCLGTGPKYVAEVLDIVTDELASLGARRA